MSGTVYIMSGISGSGKTRLAVSKTNPIPLVVSADSYFLKDHSYQFDPTKLQQAHSACLRMFLSLVNTVHDIVIDNTNTTVEEIVPYIAIAKAYGRKVERITLRCGNADDVQMCANRNTHKVPFASCLRQHERLEKMLNDRNAFSIHRDVPNTVMWVR